MSYTCLNTSCAIALSKATFPVAMNCPVCQMPLQEMAELSGLSEADEQLISTLPYVIAFPLKRALTEKHAWTRVNLLKDTFLNYLKYLGLLAASEFFHSPLKDKKMVALFQQALAEPSFGSWNQYIRETLKYLNEKQHPFFCADLPKYYEAVETGNKRKLYKGEIEYIDGNGDVQLKKQEATAIGMLINFRNRYLGHGLTLDEKASQQLWDEYFPVFRTLLEQMQLANSYPMYKHEHGETYRLQSSELTTQEKGTQATARVWMENPQGESMDILPFFVVPGEVSLGKEDKEQILAYESYTGKTIKFFSPEGTEKQTSGKILEKLNLLLRDKQKEHTYTPEEFTKEIFLARVADENKLILDTLVAEKKVIPGVYVHREDMEIKLREWIGARANIFFIAAEAGSGKTNLLVEMQKQYTERAIPTLLIRAGRMEKKSLSEQLAYLLNINPEKELSSYTNLGGTQAEPTLVLIDGLNEANQAEALWQELLDISKAFTAGSLKIVVTSRASSKADVERYALDERDAQFMYGENKEREQGLSAYVHWLTALNMAEMKDTWENYAHKEKNKYKPQFSFDDLATFDRALYSQISNPLVLRLFLETYHNKSLPKKGKKYLNIWADWLETFQEAEQVFFRLLSAAIWVKGENELLLDDILQDEILKPYLTDDRVNAPYQRLKNIGWISRYVKDLNACVSFTVEGALLYLTGKSIGTRQTSNDHSDLIAIAATGNAMKIAALENYLIEESRSGNIDFIINLIDTGEFEELCIVPIVNYLQQYGTNDFVERLLANESESDWKVIEKVVDTLEHLELISLRKSLCNELVPKCRTLQPPLSLIITILDEIEYPENESITLLIENRLKTDQMPEDEKNKMQLQLANYYCLNDQPNKAIEFYEDYLSRNINVSTNVLNTIAMAYSEVHNNSKSASLYRMAFKQYFEKHENDKSLEAMLHFNLAVHEPDPLIRISHRERALELDMEEKGLVHSETARTIIAIALARMQLKEFPEAKTLLDKGYAILKSLDSVDSEIMEYYGFYHEENNEIEIAISYYQGAIDLEVKANGGKSSRHFRLVDKLGWIYFRMNNYEKCLVFFNQAIESISHEYYGWDYYYQKLFRYNWNIGGIHYEKNDYELAIEYYTESIKIHQENATDYSSKHILDLQYSMALCYYHSNQYHECIEILNKIIAPTIEDLSLKYDIFKLLGDAYFFSELYIDAIHYYDKTLPLTTEFGKKVKILEFIAACYENTHQLNEALKHYQKCIDIAASPDEEIDSSRFYYFIGKIHRQLKNIDEAIIQFQKGQSISPKWYFSYQIAGCMEEMSDFANALKLYIEVAEMLKDNPEAGLNDKDTLESIQHAKRLAKELGTVGDLPQWITETNT
jgi:tetratricopeptide (TPR) repeat protein